ncbi:MAG: tetratricopeptide repeat protein [Pyrinomonadaceae bacterium]
MAFDKNKVMRAAERFLTQGRISSAIKEYKSVLENDSSDVNTQNMLGDLYLKSDDKKSAIKCYTEVAEYYNSHGYEKKAIAIYNKLYRIEPNSPEISIKLAELYQVRGSNAEAEKHYEQVADYYEKKGNKVDALTVWEKIAEISPRNTEIYLKIGNFYWQNNQKEEAARAFTEGGLRLAESGKHAEAVAAFSRSFEVAPDDLAAVRGFVNSQINLGYPEEAIKMLDELYERDLYNADVVFLLVDCYLDMEQPEKAEIIIVELVTREPKAYAKLLHLVDFYMKKNDLDSSVRILSTITEQLLVSQKPERLLDLLNEIVARNPEQIQALRLLTRYYSWHKNDYELKKVLEQLAEAANYNESITDEHFALTQLLLISPEEPKYAYRLKEISEIAKSQESEMALAETVESDSDKKIPTFESFDGLLNGNGNGSIPAEEISISEDEEKAAIELTEADLHEEEEIVVTAAEINSVADELNIDDQIANLNFYIEQGYLDIALETLKELDDQHGIREEFEEIRQTLQKMKEESEALSAEVVAEDGEPEISTEEDQMQDPAREAIDVDPVSETAVSANDVSVETSDAPVEEAEESTDNADDADVPTAKADLTELVPNDDELIETVEVRAAEHSEDVLSSQETPKTEEAEDAADERQTKSPSNEDDQAPVNENADPEMADTEPDAAEPEPEMAETRPEPPEPELTKSEPVEKSLSASDEKYETHYHHAVAYQEMGLIEDAIREFQCAVECVDPTNASGRFFQCCTLLGHCFIEKGASEDAIQWFEKALEIEELSESEATGLNYELGIAHTLTGNYPDALQYFEEVYETDREYRNVESRLEECREKAGLVAA